MHQIMVLYGVHSMNRPELLLRALVDCRRSPERHRGSPKIGGVILGSNPSGAANLWNDDLPIKIGDFAIAQINGTIATRSISVSLDLMRNIAVT